MNLNKERLRRTSKFLSLVLRHQPEKIGITLNPAGWTSIDDLIKAMSDIGKPISRAELQEVVANNDKKRFVISDDGLEIRARQGHSVAVELGYQPSDPPEFLLHGTPTTAVDAIRREGLKKMKRHHVHLHWDRETAETVGSRRGKPVLLRIRSKDMAKEGYVFYVTSNEVWLTDHVPAQCIDFPTLE
ncbi:MAG: RNA 2'-phosphotransferase [Planctomycetota bacterium]